MNIDGLRDELGRRAALTVRWPEWDPYILGETDHLLERSGPAGELAEREARRWQRGRFESLAVCVADAVFGKQKGYEVAIRTAVRPFAMAHQNLSLDRFCELHWSCVYERTFERTPTDLSGQRHHHLSAEGRIRTIVDAAAMFRSLGVLTPSMGREHYADPKRADSIESAMGRVHGIDIAVAAGIRMNLGVLTVRPDDRVRRVLGPLLQIPPTAAAATFRRALDEVAPDLGLEPFVVDQIIWYTEFRARS
jgi:hypothetical protein